MPIAVEFQTYACEFCGVVYLKKSQAKDCEQSHEGV